MSFDRPTLAALIERARADVTAHLPGADSRLRHSALDALVRMHAGAAHGLYGHLDWISRQILADTADAEFLDRRVAEKGMRRKAATASTGPATATGTNGSVIAAGSVLVRADGAEFAVVNAAVVAGGSATLQVVAAVPGPEGDCPALQPLVFASPVVGVSATVTVAAPGLTGGFAEEDDAALLARYLFEVREAPHGGNRADYERWAREVAGVSRAWVYPDMLGRGTVGVGFVIDGRSNIIPAAPDVAVVQAYIDARRPVGAEVTVFAPVPVPLDLVIRAVPPTPAVEAAIVAELADLLVRDAAPGGTILRSRIGEAISIAAGETDHQLIAPIGNVAHAAGEIAVPGAVSWVV